MKNPNIAESKFRPLKKELKKTFAKIRQAVKGEDLPSKNDMMEFMGQIEVMISYPGFGDEYYDSFMHLCIELNSAFRAKDQIRFNECLKSVISAKNLCHAGLQHQS
jgi:XXXCH domain-containing protein